MKLLIFMSSVLFITNISAPDCTKKEPEKCLKSTSITSMNEDQLFNYVFGNLNETTLKVEDIKIIELEEELNYDFDTKDYLPEGFNPLKGKDDLDWSEIELVELEEELEYDFDTKDYLPVGFNPIKGKHDLDWSEIELVELEEELEYDFDTKDYLPVGFNPIKGKHDLDWSKIELVELEEELEYDFDTKDYLPEGFNASKIITNKIVKICINTKV